MDMSHSLSYLKYLRDLSRKMVFRAGFDMVFPGTARNPDCLSLLNESRSAPWFTKAFDESKKSDRKIFFGIGTLTGKLKQANGRSKKIAAPLFLAQVTIDPEGMIAFIQRESLSLNYDIVQYLLNTTVNNEEAENIDFNNPDLVTLRHLLDGIADRASRLILPKEIGVTEQNIIGSQIDELIASTLADFRTINSHFSFSELPNLKASKQLIQASKQDSIIATNSCFFFSGKFPDQLSTYTSLNQLTAQIQNTNSENKLIEDLLNSAFEDQSFALQNPTISEEQIRQAIKYIPFTLSERQKNSVYQAWTNKVSYIQGPPGTGKSHTIAAIMLSAFFLGKKVLLVSQKKAAIEVVRSKLRELSGGDDALIFISEKTEVKNLIRERLSNIIQDVAHDSNHEKLNREIQNHRKLGDEIQRKRDELAELRTQIKRLVDVQREFYKRNSEFLSLRDNFVKTFRTGQIPFATLENDVPAKWLMKLGETGKKREKGFSNFTGRDIIVLKALRKKAINDLGANREELDILKPSFELYLTQLVNCCKHYSETSWLTKVTRAADDINNFREMYRFKLEEIIKLQKKYLSSKQRMLIRENLKQRDERENLDSFRAMLWNTSPSLIEEKMTKLDYNHLTNVFPLWAGLIRDLGSYLRFDAELFDLVIVDESSQVNIAEVLPAFYRGKSICVVGDRKQLGLNAAGLFALNRQFEDMAWNSHFGRSYNLKTGDEKGLLVSKHSILEFITNPNNNIQAPSSTLNEHFRSAPKLAEFTSQKFYADEGGLNIMTLVGDKVTRPCFKAIHVDGERELNERFVPKEIDATLSLLSQLVRDKSWKTDPLLKNHFRNNANPSIGILSFTTDSNIIINSRLRDEFTEEEISEYKIFAGTTEEFQGNERNIMILVLGSDSSISRSSQFYSDRRRVNVATSRAINFTFVIYGGIPSNFNLINSYLRFFDVPIEEQTQPLKLVEKYYNWHYDESKVESEFEGRVYPFLCEFAAKQYPGQPWKVFNQVPSCGKRIDFVLFNPVSCRALAIEVDGPDHYDENSTNYTDTHLERESILLRAGWDILHIPYYKWYSNGWLGDRLNKVFSEYLVKLSTELKNRIERAPTVH